MNNMMLLQNIMNLEDANYFNMKLSELKNIIKEVCWEDYKVGKPKTKISSRTGKRVPNCVPIKEEDEITEAKYKGRTVTLNKPMRGDTKKFKVYVNSGKKNADGSIKVKKVEFGARGMNIKKNNPKRRAAFRARHNCTNPGPKTKARYWSCRKW